jgi:tetratricopeptide (TPR) repeat protein
MMEKIEKSLKGIDTFKSYSDRYAKNPRDVEAAFKLATKYNDRIQDDKALEWFKKVVELGPDKKEGTYITVFEKARVSFLEFSEYQIALITLRSSQYKNPEPIKAFIKKYPGSELLIRAYRWLSSSMAHAPKEEAIKFFEEYVTKFPYDPDALNAWLTYIVRAKGNMDKGIELAEKIESLTKFKSLQTYNRTMADLYFLKEDDFMAHQVYGKDFIEGRTRIFVSDLLRYADYWAGKNENLESAEEMAELALLLQPGYAHVFSRAAAVYLKMNKEDRAMELFGPAYVQENQADHNNLWSYANFWAQQGKNLDSALEAAKKVVELKPDEYFGWDVLGAVHLKKKNFEEAIKAAEKALELAEGSMIKDYMKTKLNMVKAAIEREKKK